MPRIRTIKPEFWSDEKLAPCDPVVRLVFLALLSMADDYGRIIDNEKQIEAFVFPFGDGSRETREALATLSRLSRVRRGRAQNGQRIIEICHWERHQKVDKPSTKTALPQIVATHEVVESSASPRETVASGSRSDLGSGPRTEDPRSTTSPAREAFLEASGSGRTKWVAQLRGWEEGLGTPGMKPIDPQHIDAGLLEYLTNEADPDFGAAHVLGYVTRVANRKPYEAPPPLGPRRPFGTTGYLAGVIAAEQAKREKLEGEHANA